MMLFIKRNMRKIIIACLLFVLFGYLMSSCLQFRMSKSEIDDYFEGQPIQPEVSVIEVGDRSINYAYIESGDLPLVVFAHGAPGSLSSFIKFLNDKELQSVTNMISYDRPGYGYSNFGWAEPSLEVHAHCLAAIIKKHRSNQQVFLVGHSLGGPVVAKLAMEYPELVDGLIIVAGSIDPEQEKQEWYRPLGRNFIGKTLLPRSLWVTNEEILFLKGELEQMLPFWENLTIPTIVIQGDEDKLVPKENAFFAQKMMQSEYLDVWLEEGVNHFIPWNQSHLINKAILEQINGFTPQETSLSK